MLSDTSFLVTILEIRIHFALPRHQMLLLFMRV